MTQSLCSQRWQTTPPVASRSAQALVSTASLDNTPPSPPSPPWLVTHPRELMHTSCGPSDGDGSSGQEVAAQPLWLPASNWKVAAGHWTVLQRLLVAGTSSPASHTANQTVWLCVAHTP